MRSYYKKKAEESYQKGVLDGASKQRKNTAALVFSYIIDHGEIIPE